MYMYLSGWVGGWGGFVIDVIDVLVYTITAVCIYAGSKMERISGSIESVTFVYLFISQKNKLKNIKNKKNK